MTTFLRCPSCGRKCKLPEIFPLYCVCGERIEKPAEIVSTCQVIRKGVGTILGEILAELGFKPTAACRCGDLKAYMDRIGVVECQRQIAYLSDEVRSNAKDWPLGNMLKNVAGSLLRPKALAILLSLNVADPFTSLVQLAIDRANEKTP